MRLRDIFAERVNQELFKPGFHDEKVLPNGLKLTVKPNQRGTGIIINAYMPDGKEAGFARFLSKRDLDDTAQENLEAGFVIVYDEYKRQGVASAMYQYARELGNDIVPSLSQSADAKAFWRAGAGASKEMAVAERQDPYGEIENMSVILPGDLDEYFIRFTDVDKIGFSAQQHFGRMRDTDDPEFDPDSLYDPKGRPALWFYPLRYYLEKKKSGLFASENPYVWLVRIRPDAWLQPVKNRASAGSPPGKRRVGVLKSDAGVPIAVFFEPAFDVIDRWHQPPQKSNKQAKDADAVNELQILSKVKGKGTEPSRLPKFGREIRPGEESRYLGRKMANYKNYEIWRESLGGQISYTLFDPSTRRAIINAFGSRYTGNIDSFVVSGLYAAPENPVPAAEFYRALILELGLTLVSDRKQSPGGQRVWQYLEQFDDIKVYGYDTRADKVLNISAQDEEMYAVPPGAARDRETKYTAKNIRLVATAR